VGPVKAAAATATLVAIAGILDEAAACTVCNSGTGAAVRAGIAQESLLLTLLGTLSPFPILLVIVLAIHLGWTPAKLLRERVDGSRRQPEVDPDAR
jgi:hypothetical protein